MLARTERVRNAFPIAVGWNIPRAGSSAARGCKHHQGRQQAPECAEQQLLGARLAQVQLQNMPPLCWYMIYCY